MVARKTDALAPLAREINTRLSKAETMEGKADDHRLAACIQLAEAKTLCKVSRIPFKKWSEENIQYAYETVRKYATVGASPNPQQALADMRKQAREAMAESRASKGPRTISDHTPEGQERHRRTQAAIAVDRFSRVPEHQRTEVLKELLAVDPDATTEAIKRQINELRAKDRIALLLWLSDDLGVELSAEVAKALGIEKKSAA